MFEFSTDVCIVIGFIIAFSASGMAWRAEIGAGFISNANRI